MSEKLKKLKFTVMAILCVGIVVGIVFILLQSCDREYKIFLQENGVTTEKLAFSATGLAPGVSREYNVLLSAKTGGKYKITLIFEGEGNVLQNYLDVEIEYNGDKKVSKLSDLLKGQAVHFECDVLNTATITIRYILPIDTGNEVQGEQTDLNITFISER